MKRKQLLSLFACAPLCAGLLLSGGCSDKGADKNGTAVTSPAPGSTPGEDVYEGDKKLVIAWAEWEPAKQLEILTKDFTKETGIAVQVQQFPWSDFENKVKLAWSAQDPTYDMIVGDSQWLGKGATQQHYMELTDWAKQNIPVADIAPAALNNYGEYPQGSSKLYAIPCMSDALVFAYRKDLFENAANKSAFKTKHGRELAPPKTWDEFKQAAEFFTKPASGQYGCAVFYSKEYDGATMGFDPVLWAYGAQLSDGKKVEGVINSPQAVEALTYYASLKPFTPPGSENYYFSECLRDFGEGKVAMAESWFAFCPDLTKPEKNKFVKDTGYFMVPAGRAGRFVSLGGQGLSLSAYSKHQNDAKKFMAWFSKEDTQKKWVALGGLTANNKVAATPEFKKATPYNVVFSESVPYLKDFYNTPNYSELLTVSQKELNQALSGAQTPKAALDTIAKTQQGIMDSGR